MDGWHHPVEVGGHVAVDAAWEIDKSPFIAAGDITVNSGKSLTVMPGVKVEFDGFFSLEVYGALQAPGSVDSVIHFTSHGSLPGGWQGIQILEGDGSFLDYCRIDSSQRALFCLNSSPTIANSWLSGDDTCLHISGTQASPSIQGCELDLRGGLSEILILCDSSSTPTVTYCSITDASKGVVAKNGSNPQLTSNNIYNNSEYGVMNDDSTVLIDAQSNWWGDESGPFDPVDNPDGLGDRVSEWVDYTPWLLALAPYTCGDANTDSSVGVVDVVFLINYLFKGGPPPDPLDTGNVNCDEGISLADIVFLINYLFYQGPLPCDCPLQQTIIARHRSA